VRSRVTSASRRFHPHGEERLDLDDVRLLTPARGPPIFSAAQLHSTVPNTTVNLDHLVERVGATNVDSACIGTTLRDPLHASDLRPPPEEVIAGPGKRTAAATLVAPWTRPVG
jgi:hypothetical protein